MAHRRIRDCIPEITVMTVGFAVIGLMIGVAAWDSGKPPLSILIFAGMGAGFGAFLGLWGSMEPDER